MIRHARDLYSDVDPDDVQRESISGLTDPMFYKLKTGRWRGAMYVDPDGTPWLCAAGLRRENETTDFYAWFMERVKSSGPGGFLPTHEPTAWQPGHTAEAQIFSLQSGVGLRHLLDALPDISRAGIPAEPQLSHRAKKELLVGSAVNWEAVHTLCGAWLVQSRDAEKLPTCPTCAEIHAGLPQSP